MIDLTGKTALVTGGSRGIGRAIVLRLARQGADVAFSYRGNQAAAEATVAEVEGLGRRGLAVQADAKEQEGAEALVKAVLDAFGRIDILVNNAGITRDDLIMRMKAEDWTDVLETNLFGAFWALKACTRPMLKARSGRVINITSVSGQAGQMGQANYSSAKAGLIGLTKAAARELASRGITVNAVAPGFVLTELDAGPAGGAPGADHRAHAARPLRHAGGDRGRRRVPRLGRGRVHHRAGAGGGRRPGDDVAVPFTVEPTAIDGVRLVRPRLFRDERGWFTEVLQAAAFEELGLPSQFVQVNQSRSAKGVVRGLHFQWDPPQGKLMRVVTGRAFMVAVDIRPGSPTLGSRRDRRGVGRRAAPVLGARVVRPRVRGPQRHRGGRVLLHRVVQPGGRVRDPLGRPGDRDRVARGRAAPVAARTRSRGPSRSGLPAPNPTPSGIARTADAGEGPGGVGTFDWCPATPGDVSIRDVQRLVSDLRRTTRRAVPPPASLHTVAFVGGLLILALGLAGWAFEGGPGALGDIVIVLDLTIGGTLLLTGALVGRARASEARRNGQLEVLQHAARRMSANLTPADVGRAVVEETRRVIDYHNARVYLLVPPGRPRAHRVRGSRRGVREGGLRDPAHQGRPGVHGLGRQARDRHPHRRRVAATRAARRSPARTTSTSRCSSSRCSTTTG